jgi:hypothetical protein
MAKAFEQPPKGPKIGPMQEFKNLPPHRKEQLGELDKLGAEVVSQPAKLDSRVEEAAQEQAEAMLEEEKPEAPKKAPEEVAEELEALQDVLSEEDEEPDPIDVAAEPTPDDRRNFMRSILGDRAYEKEYVLFGGMLVLKLVDTSPELEDSIFAQLAVDQREEIVRTQEDWEIQLDRYRAVTNVQKVISSGAELPSEQPDNLRERAALLCKKKNSTIYRAILRTVRVFRRHLDFLVERSMQSDFWQVDGLSSPSEPTRQEQSDTIVAAAQEVGT